MYNKAIKNCPQKKRGLDSLRSPFIAALYENMMKEPIQECYYFREDLEKYKIFVELSELHWKEEFEKYSLEIAGDVETQVAERYGYKNDLCAHIESEFPQYQRQSYLFMIVAKFEDFVRQLCLSLQEHKHYSDSIESIKGSGIERGKKYLKMVCGILVPDDARWSIIMDAQNIRNIIAHNAGHLDPDKHTKQIEIIRKSDGLESEEYARIHLSVTGAYLIEIIESMKGTERYISEQIV